MELFPFMEPLRPFLESNPDVVDFAGFPNNEFEVWMNYELELEQED